MIRVFVGTSNKGKQYEIRNFARLFSANIKLVFPDPKIQITIDETGSSYAENALLKAKAYTRFVDSKSTIFVGDDSGLRIPALNNLPGVKSRRWAGYEMNDKQILDYCLQKMTGLQGEDRKAVFETVLVALKNGGSYATYTGELWGYILEKPNKSVPLDGFPFRETFWIDELQKTWGEAVKNDLEARHGFLTNREKAFKKMFEDLSAIDQ